MAAPSQQMSPQQLNSLQRAMVLSQAIEMKQQIFSQVIADPTKQQVVNVTPRNVGLITKFVVVVDADANNTDGADAATPSDLGVANLLDQIVFTDLNNNQRIQTTGAHVFMVSTMKRKTPFGAALTDASISGVGSFGDNFDVMLEPASIALGTTDSVRGVFEVPITYSKDDLRGGIYANVVNATMNLALSININAFADKDVDSTNAVYKGASGTLTAVKITVYQYYLDQLPVGKNGVVLPMLDLSTIYELKNTRFNAIAVGQDFPVPYANFRDFLSTFAIFNSDPSKDAGRLGGGDVNYFALQSANFTNIFKIDPVVAALEVRDMLHTDLPKGLYYFDHRRKPISTTQYGNMELVLNPKAAAAGSYLQIGWEDFAIVNTLTQAGSLAG